MKGIYLASYRAMHDSYDIDYQDINGLRDIGGDMMEVDLSKYDYIIATPPCNYYSRTNWRRESSPYSQLTKHLLPDILKKLCKQQKPFIVENVRNSVIFKKLGLYNLPVYIYEIGRHTYWTNILLPYMDIDQKKDNIKYTNPKDRQGGENVHNVIEVFLSTLQDYINII